MSQSLTLEDVEHHVGALPRDVRDRLALGPIPDDDPAEQAGCRVCDAIGPDSRAMRYAHPRDRLHAHELWTWHECGVGDLFELADEANIDLDDDAAMGDPELWRAALGALSYARCCVIYAMARASTARAWAQ